MGNIISIENLTYIENKKKILNDISLDLSTFQIVGLLGDENSGKTELLQILSTLRKGYQGKIYCANSFLNSSVLKYISFFEDPILSKDTFTVEEKIKSIFSINPKLYSQSILDSLLSNFMVNKSKKIKDLSKKELNRLYLALAISKRSLIYLFDEPLKYFDENEYDYVLYSINEYCYTPDTLIIISSSDMDEIDSFCTLAVFLKDGKITLVGQPKTLHEIHDTSLKGVYKEVHK